MSRALPGFISLLLSGVGLAAAPYFEANVGQADPEVRYLSRGTRSALLITPRAAVFLLSDDESSRIVRVTVSCARLAEPRGEEPLAARVHSLLGNDPACFRTDAPTFARVRQEAILPGIDLVHHAERGKLEQDYVVHPGADPKALRLEIEGADSVTVDAEGNLHLRSGPGEVVYHRPVLLQKGEDTADARYRILERPRGQGTGVAFDIPAFDGTKVLIIDPAISYSTYLGGSANDSATRVARDGAGNVYVVGYSASVDYPVANAYQGALRGGRDAVITKLDSGGRVVFSTYLGGSYLDRGSDIAVDAAGSAYVVGQTGSTDFPLMNPYLSTPTPGFLAKLDPAGASLVFSTYTPGTYYGANAVGVDSSGSPFVLSEEVIRLDPSGTGLIYSTSISDPICWLGCSVNDMAVDAAGNAYLAGGYYGDHYGWIAYGWRLDPSGNTVDSFGGSSVCDHLYYWEGMGTAIAVDAGGGVHMAGATRWWYYTVPGYNYIYGDYQAFVDDYGCFGGSGNDKATDVTVEENGNVHVAGSTTSVDFPTLYALQGAKAGGTDAFVTSFNGASTTMIASSYFGGSGNDSATGIVADRGTVTIVGGTTSTDLPVANAYQPAIAGGSDAFVARIAYDCTGALTLSPVSLLPATAGSPYSQTITASGGSPPYAFGIASGAAPPGIGLSRQGVLSGTPAVAGIFGFTVRATDGATGCGSQEYVLTVLGGSAGVRNIMAGGGLGYPNQDRVRAFVRDGTFTPVDFLAYGAGHFGVNVASGNLNGATYAQIVTGPGPGAMYGPTVRGFQRDGTAMGKINFYAYGTLRFGVNVDTGDLDADGLEEILTGAGPGAVFGPHVRGFNFDGVRVDPLAKVTFFALGTPRFGVNVASGSIDLDPYEEIIAGAGPSAAFAPLVRAFNYDGSSVTSVAKVNFWAFPVLAYGVNVAAGDLDGDAIDEIAATPGPGPGALFLRRFRGFNYDAILISTVPGFDVTRPEGAGYGGRVGLGHIADDPREELLTGAGPDPAASALVRPYLYWQYTMYPLASFPAFSSGAFGVNVASAELGY